jgi:hypothetical protein
MKIAMPTPTKGTEATEAATTGVVGKGSDSGSGFGVGNAILSFQCHRNTDG